MGKRGKRIILSVLTVLCIGVHLYSSNTERVEYQYVNHFYVFYSNFLRTCLGNLPFSLGDIFYGFIFCWIVWRLAKGIRNFFIRKEKGIIKWASLYNMLTGLLIVYLIFNISWGLNYNRKGIAYQTNLEVKEYTPQDLKQMNQLLVEKVNQSKLNTLFEKKGTNSTPLLFKKAILAYQKASDTFSFLKYNHPAVKSSMWGWLGNYLGYTGYYNPFTGEAQVNTTIPETLQPFIVCHEIAHQLGYAKENEANFVAYLVCKHSSDELFKYAAYLDLFFYANRNLYYYDSVSAIRYRDRISIPVKRDIENIIAFNRAHSSFIEPAIAWMFDLFLKGNQQPKGMMSYNQVTAYLISYYRKFGEI